MLKLGEQPRVVRRRWGSPHRLVTLKVTQDITQLRDVFYTAPCAPVLRTNKERGCDEECGCRDYRSPSMLGSTCSGAPRAPLRKRVGYGTTSLVVNEDFLAAPWPRSMRLSCESQSW